MNPENAIEVSNVEKSFRVHLEASHQLKDAVLFANRNKVQERKVLRGISFNVKKGEAIALIGKNGCGKSTTLKLLTKILRPDSGSIEMRGRVSSLIELGAGFHPDMTGRENVFINASIFGIKRKEIERRMDEIIRFSELEEFIDNPVRTYSSGMYMRLAFAVAINVNADILLIDEILAVGDAAFQEKCFARIKSLKAAGVTVVIVSHSISQVKSICDRAIWIENGLIKEAGDTYRVCAHYMEDMDERRVARDSYEKAQMAGQTEKSAIDKYRESLATPEALRAINRLCEIDAKRSGAEGLSFKKIDLLDEDGKNAIEFTTGKKMTFVMRYGVNKECLLDSLPDKGEETAAATLDTGALVGLSFTNDSGLTYFYTAKAVQSFGGADDECVATFTVEELPLLWGKYYLTFRLEDNHGGLQDRIHKFMSIMVATPWSQECGLINIPHRWDVQTTADTARQSNRAYDYLIVGAGLYGAAFACKATAAGKKCLVIEKRDHIAGNLYTERIENIDVHRYGAHIFHTNNKPVWDFVNQFAEFNRYTNSPVADYKGERYNLPFNMNTFNRMWGVRTPDEAWAKIEEQRRAAGIGEPKNLEEQAISLVGTDIYEKLIQGYTQKQWGRPCAELPAFIIKRLPVRFTYDNNYFDAQYQGIPVDGYTRMVEKMLAGVPVRLNTDYLADKAQFDAMADTVVYTGPIDAFYDYRLGALEYRSVRFETEVLEQENYQGNAVINYTDAETPYTRIIEHKHFTGGGQPKTVISREYSAEWKPGVEPYYPVNDEKNEALYKKYRALADAEPDVIFGGRLGEYKYYDMDKVIEEALEKAKRSLG